jgi:BMFP domain-containing protein YqiC
LHAHGAWPDLDCAFLGHLTATDGPCFIVAEMGRLGRTAATKEIMMRAGSVFEGLSKRVQDAVAASPARDLEKNAKALVTGALAKLDVVSRQEFDVQATLLLRTREKLEALEARVAALEAKASIPEVPPDAL